MHERIVYTSVRIETQRLYIYPVSNDEMRKIIDDETDPEMKQAYSEMLEGCIKHPNIRVWYAVWLMELKDNPGIIVGDLCFKGLNDNGMVEIGYGLRDGFCGFGYMTESVKAVCGWALKQEGVQKVEAETDPDNKASQKILTNCGFVPTGVIGEEGPRFVLQC